MAHGILNLFVFFTVLGLYCCYTGGGCVFSTQEGCRASRLFSCVEKPHLASPTLVSHSSHTSHSLTQPHTPLPPLSVAGPAVPVVEERQDGEMDLAPPLPLFRIGSWSPGIC